MHLSPEFGPTYREIEKDGFHINQKVEMLVSSDTPNGALYIAKTDYFRSKKTFYTSSTFAYLMPPERSVDIDNQIDFLLLKPLLAENILN